jgi:hypothetical protein
VHAVTGSGQIGRTSGKCSFVGRFILCTVHIILLRLPNERKGDGQGLWYVVGQEKSIEGFGEET